MSLCKNCGWWKHFDYIFEFSVKCYVRNTINLSCAKILLPSAKEDEMPAAPSQMPDRVWRERNGLCQRSQIPVVQVLITNCM
jgi:hypothetical protein